MSRRFLLVIAIACEAAPVYAQVIATPYAHVNFGDVEIRRGGLGGSLGYLGRRLGFELDLDRHQHFYKDKDLEFIPNPCAPGVMGPCIDDDTDAWIVMGNAVVRLPTWNARWQPHATAGAGLIYAWIHGAGEYNSDQYNLAMNLGAGLTYWATGWLGFRADVRYFHAFVDEDKLDGGYRSDYDFLRVSLGISVAQFKVGRRRSASARGSRP